MSCLKPINLGFLSLMHGRRDNKCRKSDLKKMSPLTVLCVVSSVPALVLVYSLRYVRESITRSLLYAVRRSRRRLESVRDNYSFEIA